MAPAAGFEPATKWLTATYSTAELCRSVSMFLNIVRFEEKGKLKIEKIVVAPDGTPSLTPLDKNDD